MNEKKSLFWGRVDSLRKGKNLQWADLASDCGLSRATISTMKRRETLPDYRTGCRIRRVLETTDSFLLEEDLGVPERPEFPPAVLEKVRLILSHKLGAKILTGLPDIPDEQYSSILAVIMAFHPWSESLKP